LPYCRKCGSKLEENAHFCDKCGTPIITLTPPLPPTATNRSIRHDQIFVASMVVIAIVVLAIIIGAAIFVGFFHVNFGQNNANQQNLNTVSMNFQDGIKRATLLLIS